MNTLYIRLDANPTIGMGHFFRCLSLAGYLRKNHKITFLIRNPSTQVKKILEDQKLGFIAIPMENDLGNLKKYLNSEIDLVLDGYHFDYNFQKKIRPFCKRLFFIDDLNEGKFCSDYVINHSLSALEENYPEISGVKYLLGYDYILLREEFLNTSPNKVPRQKVENITICMGGADKDNLTLKLAELVINLQESLNLNLVFGAASKNLAICKEKLGKDAIYHTNLNAQEMCDLLKKTDIVMAPASGIAHESISLGIPLITGVIAKNHEQIAEFIGKKSLGINLGWFSDIDSWEINKRTFQLIKNIELRRSINKNQLGVIDRKSPERFKEIFSL